MYVATKTETEILKLLENGESLTKNQIIEKEVEGYVVKGVCFCLGRWVDEEKLE